MEILKNLAQIAPLGTFFIAFYAIYIATKQLKTAKKNEAMKQYLSFLDDCIKYPCLLKVEQKNSLEDYDANYRYFVSKMLMACESILDEYSDDKEWENSIYSNLKLHAFYLKLRNNNTPKHTAQIQKIISRVI